MQQQNAYIESLEKLQSEMRRFRHDYKNMMSGMYLQAKEGNMEAVQNFIQDMKIGFLIFGCQIAIGLGQKLLTHQLASYQIMVILENKF